MQVAKTLLHNVVPQVAASTCGQVTARTASITAHKPTSEHLKELRAGPTLPIRTRSLIRRSQFTRKTKGEIVIGSCQLSVLSLLSRA